MHFSFFHLFHAYKITEECVVISNYDEEFRGIPVDGEYRRLNKRFFVKNDISLIEDETLMLIEEFDGKGWSGCKGNVRAFEDRVCNIYERFAYFPDISKPVIGNVNIWEQKGDSSGILHGKCGQHGIMFMEGSNRP